MLFVDVKVEGVIGVLWVVGVSAQRLFPANDLADVLDDGFALREVRHRKNTFSMNTRASGLNASSRNGRRGLSARFLSHLIFLLT